MSDDAGGAHQMGGAEGGGWAVERAEFLDERLAPLLADARHLHPAPPPGRHPGD